jgi:phenylacetate-CoA ligase
MEAMNGAMSRKVLQLHEQVTGRGILDRLDELNRIQWLSRDELLSIQRNKLCRLVEYAYNHVPYYRRIFDSVGFLPADLDTDMDNFGKLPVLTKAIIRENRSELLTSEAERRLQMSPLATSGSTGEPLSFLQDHDFRDAVTADTQHHLGWAGWQLGDLHAIIWGASFKPTLGRRIRGGLIDRVWNRFQTNAFFMTDKSMAAFAERIHRQNPRILFGYATSIYRFAQFVRSSPYAGITFDGVFTSAETLLPPMRDLIEETFRCRVFNRYGTLELGCVACECEAHNGMHINIVNNYVEILRDGRLALPGEVGDFIVTNLNNLGMPFIRYSIGDVGAWSKDDRCPCRRESPRISLLEGRIVDSFRTQDGHIAWSGFAGAAFRCLTHPSIRQFQVIQKSLDRMVIRLVRDGEIPQATLEEIRQAVYHTFGDRVEVDFDFTEEIPALPSGKHSYAVSELNQSKNG